jgi:nitrogen fixation protein FixH
VAKARGNAIVTLDAQETARWKAAAKPLIDAWIVEMDGKGLNGKQLVEDVRAMVAKYAGPEQ